MHSPLCDLTYLTVDDKALAKVDPQDPMELHSLWQSFNKVSPALEQGKRLENLSWRMLSSQAIRRASQPSPVSSSATLHPITNPQSSSDPPTEAPELSRSPDSVCSDGSRSSSSSPTETDTPFSTYRSLQNSSCSDRRFSRHTKPIDLQMMVSAIKHKPGLTKLPMPTQLPPTMAKSAPSSMPTLPPQAKITQVSPRPIQTEESTSTIQTSTSEESHATSNTSVSPDESTHSIVRGFTPGTSGITSYTSKTQLAPSISSSPTPILRGPSNESTKSDSRKRGIFTLGSGSSNEDESSLRNRMSPRCASQQTASGSKKQTSFKEEVVVVKNDPPYEEHPAVFDSDDESDISDDNAIEDDDDDEDDEEAWEDETNDDKEEDKEIKFHRVDSKANLRPNRSLLTLNFEEQRNGRSHLIQNNNYRSSPALRRARTSPNGPSMPASPTEDDSAMQRHANRMQTSQPIVMGQPQNEVPNAMPIESPRTTKRNMLCGELSETLRYQMLNERRFKTPYKEDTSQIRRAHTSTDVKGLGRLPGIQENPSNEQQQPVFSNTKPVNWNHFFNHSMGEYHEAGW